MKIVNPIVYNETRGRHISTFVSLINFYQIISSGLKPKHIFPRQLSTQLNIRLQNLRGEFILISEQLN